MSINENKRKCDRCEFIKEECWLAQHSDGKWYCGICQGDIYYEKMRAKVDDWANGVGSDWLDNANREYIADEERKHKLKYCCWDCGAEKQIAGGDNPYCGKCYTKHKPEFPYSTCNKCKKKIENLEGLCPCVQKEVAGFNGKETFEICKDCGNAKRSSTCELCLAKFTHNLKPMEHTEWVSNEIANDYTFNFCPWCKQDMVLKCNEDWTLKSGAIAERKLHLENCSFAPQSVKNRVKEDMKTDSKVIAEQMKKGSFRKNPDVKNGKYDGNTGKEINNNSPNQNSSMGDQGKQENNAFEFPWWVIPLFILWIGVLVGLFFLWRWWRRWKARDIYNAVNYFKCRRCSKEFCKTYQTEKDVCNGCFEPPVKEVVEKQPTFKKRRVFNKSYQKNYQTAKQTDWNNASTKTSYFTCGKCSLVYKGNMEGSNGNCLKCE